MDQQRSIETRKPPSCLAAIRAKMYAKQWLMDTLDISSRLTSLVGTIASLAGFYYSVYPPTGGVSKVTSATIFSGLCFILTGFIFHAIFVAPYRLAKQRESSEDLARITGALPAVLFQLRAIVETVDQIKARDLVTDNGRAMLDKCVQGQLESLGKHLEHIIEKRDS